MKNEAAQPIVEVRNLKEYFNINMGMFRTKPLKAVDNVSFAIQPGETLGLVGESGCGKTTVGRTILHLYKPTGGEVLYKGRKIQTKADIQAFRNKASMVFQDPYSSLNPRMTVRKLLEEPLLTHFKLSPQEVEEQVGYGTWNQWDRSESISFHQLRVGDWAFQNKYPTDQGNHIGICIGFDQKGKPLFLHCASSFDNVVVTGAGDVFRYARRPLIYSQMGVD